MADKTKLEQMLEKLVNDDRKGAEELFHEFVIEKSRDIYSGLLEDDIKDLEVTEKKDEDEEDKKDEETKEASDTSDKDEDAVEEETDEETTEEKDEEVSEEIPTELTPEADDDMGGDPADDMLGDIEADAEGEMGDDDSKDGEEIEDRVVDLEDALDDLKAEFEKMMSDKGGDEDEGEGDDAEMDMDAGDEEGDEEAEEESFDASELGVEEQPAFEGKKSEAETIREYVNKVSAPTGGSDDNTKSPVAGKNDMGGTTANITKGSKEETGGKAEAPKEENAGNVNVPGGKASKSLSKDSKGHGAEKKGSGESADNKDSVIGS